MAFPELSRDFEVANMAGHQNDGLAPVIPLIPSQDEKGSFFHNIARYPLAPLHVAHAIGRVAFAIGHDFLGHHDALVKKVIVPINGYNQLVLVSEPDPQTGVDPNEAANCVALPGLAEMGDISSAYFLHLAEALQNPSHRTITVTSDGISRGGQLLPLREAYSRPFEIMAANRLAILPQLVKDGPVNLIGTSMGSVLSMYMAEQNLAANAGKQLNIEKLKLVASAVIACNIQKDEDFRDADIDEELMRHELTQQFFRHLPGDALRMLRSNPEQMARCAVLIGEYALRPHKLPQRALTIAGNLKSVQRGIDWRALKQIADGYKISVLGGELDPLAQAQVAQWDAIAGLFHGQVQQKLLEGKGHLMTVAGVEIAKALHQMDLESANTELRPVA